MVELGTIASSVGCTMRTTNSVVEPVGPSKTMFLWPTGVSPCISLCLWMGLVIHWVRISSDDFMEWIERITSEFVHGIFVNPLRIQDPQSPIVVFSSLLCNRQKASGKL